MPSVRVKILPWLSGELGLSKGKPSELVEQIHEGQSAGELLTQLASRYPRFGDVVFGVVEQHLQEQVAVILNGHLLHAPGDLGAPLHDGDAITILPGFSGG